MPGLFGVLAQVWQPRAVVYSEAFIFFKFTASLVVLTGSIYGSLLNTGLMSARSVAAAGSLYRYDLLFVTSLLAWVYRSAHTAVEEN